MTFEYKVNMIAVFAVILFMWGFILFEPVGIFKPPRNAMTWTIVIVQSILTIACVLRALYDIRKHQNSDNSQ